MDRAHLGFHRASSLSMMGFPPAGQEPSQARGGDGWDLAFGTIGS